MYGNVCFFSRSSLIFFFGLVALIGFFYHLVLVFTNQTQVERRTETIFIYNEDLTFNVSMSFNFEEVFGCNPLLILFPVPNSLGNGIDYFTNFNV